MEGNCRHAAAAARRCSAPKFMASATSRPRIIGVAIGAGELNEDVLAGDGIVAGWSNDGVGDAVEPRYGNQLCLGVEGVSHMHVRHDLVGGLGGVGCVLRRNRFR